MPRNLNKKISDELIAFNAQLPRLEASMRRKVRRQLKELEDKLIKTLLDVDPSAPTRTAFKKKRLEALLKTIHNDIASTYKAIKTETLRDTVHVGQLSAQATTQAINSQVGITLASVGVNAELLEQIISGNLIQGAKSADWWARQGGSLKFRFQRQIGEAIQLNETLGDMVRRIRGTRAKGFTDGIMSITTREAEGLIRTSVINANNAARLEALQANADILDGIQWVSTLDGSTTPICQSLDGLVWDMEYEPINHDTPWPGATAHWGCRSTQVPVVKEFNKQSKNKRDRIPESTRASMDGQVPEKETYDSWLKRKDKVDPAYVKKTLGPGKYKIWKSEGLSTRDMVDQYNNPLTVAELEKLYKL